jgi:hypothetical protein
MSRPDELPRSASPLKRRAPSLPPDENDDALEDVDMISVPATNHTTPVGDAESIQDAGGGGQEIDTNELNVEPLAPAIVEENDTDIPKLLDSLEVDRASVEETQVGSEPEDNALETGSPNGNDAQDQGQEQGDDKDQNSAMDNVQTQNGSRSTNSEDIAESDAKTIDTVATSASAEVSNKLCKCFHTQPSNVTC